MKLPQSFYFLGLFGLFFSALPIIQIIQPVAAESAEGDPPHMRGAHEKTLISLPKNGGDMKDKGKLTEEEGKYLLGVARRTIAGRLSGKKETITPEDPSKAIFNEKRGTFVTLTIHEGLRGCIGHIIPQETLIEGIKTNAINAAFRDPRFPPLSDKEWKNIKIEISILTNPKPLSYTDANDLLNKLSPGIDGVILKKGYHQSTFLPQVWDQLPEKKDFLSHLSLKAGLDSDAWMKGDLEVSTYQVQAFEE